MTGDVLEGYKAIADALTELYGLPVDRAISEDAAYRLATRKEDALPVKGYSGRAWIARADLLAWVERNTRKAPPPSTQLKLL